MKKYRKKPLVIEAVQWNGDNHLDIAAIKGVHGYLIEPHSGHITVTAESGCFMAHKGDWIIKGIKGELYSCKSEVFEATYDEVLNT